MPDRPHQEQNKHFPQLVWFVVTLFLYAFPFLSLFNHRGVVLGVPLILLYVFGGWAVLIVVSALLRPRR